jgi:soluble lytic murein transglycosylase
VQARPLKPGLQCRQWLSVLLGICIVFTGFSPAGTPAILEGKRSLSAQLPLVLRQWTKPENLIPTESLKALKNGFDLYFNQQYASALDALPAEQDAKAAAVVDYVLLYRAKSKFMLERYKEALDDFRKLEKQYPASSLTADGLIGQCQSLLELNNPESAIAILDSRKIDETSESLYCQARAQDQGGDKEKAIALYLRLYSKYPTSKSSPLAERDLRSLSPGALSGARNYAARLQRAENLMKANELRSARLLLAALGRVSAPDLSSSQRRILLSADVEYRLGRTATALSHLRKVTADDPSIHTRALYLEGVCNRRLDRVQTLLSLRDKALKLYPSSPSTEELCYSVATYFDVNYETAKARESYKILYQAFPKGRHSERSLWKLSVFSYLGKEYNEAAAGFWNYLRAYPNPLSAGPAIYWLGRCCEMLGLPGNARYLYGRTQALANNSYYGQRSLEAKASLPNSGNVEILPVSGIDFNQVVTMCDGIRLPSIQFAEPDDDGIRIVERARQLAAAGLHDSAIKELQWGIRNYPRNSDALNYIISRIHELNEDYSEAISSLRRIYPEYTVQSPALPDEVLLLLFPLHYLEFISAQASRTQTDPALILGLIRQESAFEEKARSKANARGLMQILPATGRRLARQARIARYNSQKLFQAETNIALGTRFLDSLLRKYGKTELALAAYNAGESRVDRWLKEFGGEDMPLFVEMIPFYETRNYVKQVLSNRAYYGLRVSSSSFSSTEKND